jgi:hypothetical protein
MTTAAATVATMNNGEDTWFFFITGQVAEIVKVNDAGVIVTEETKTRDEARQFWATAFRLAATMRRGSVMPATSEIYPEFAYCQDEADEPMAFGIA